MTFLAPWIRDRALLRSQTLWTISVALVESGLGLWLRRVTEGGTSRWLALLGGLLAARVAFSWRRDTLRERLALASGTDYHRRAWARAEAGTGAWRTREAREWIETGTRAALETRAALASLALTLPLLLWLAPAFSAAVLGAALAVGHIASLRARRTRVFAKEELRQAAEADQDEEWAHRSLSEAIPARWQSLVGRFRRMGHRRHQARREARSRIQARWSALSEASAHLAGWGLGAAALWSWHRGSMDSGTLLAFMGLSLLAYRPVREAGKLLPNLQKAAQVWAEASCPTRPVPGIPDEPGLVVARIQAGWEDGPAVLSGVEFRLPPGGMALAQGPNGCGKSTLLAALSGRIPLRAGSLARPRRLFYLGQETVLPPLPPRIWTNLPRPEATALDGLFEELFPGGIPSALDWDRPLARGGQFLSRGQRTRLALLAMVAGSYDGWLLDEPLSALPPGEGDQLLGKILARRHDAFVVWAQPRAPDWMRCGPALWTAPDGGLRVLEVSLP